MFYRIKFIIKRKFKRFVQVIKTGHVYTEQQKEIFDNAKIGDVIFCEMPMSDSSLYDVKPGHEQRPYIIVKKIDGFLVGYPSSHIKPKCLTNYKYFGIYKSINEDCFVNGKKIDAWTNSFYNLSKAKYVPIRNLRWFFQRPNDSDLDRLEKILTIRKNNNSRAIKMNRKFNLDKGDIVSDGDKLFYVYSSFKNDIYAYPIFLEKLKGNDNVKKVNAYNKSYYADISASVKLNPDLFKNIINQATSNSIKSIGEFKKKKKIEKAIIEKKKKDLFCKLIPGTLMVHKEIKDYVNIYMFSRAKKSYGVYYEDRKKEKVAVFKLERFQEYRKYEIIDRERFDKLINKMKLDQMTKDFIVEQRNTWEERLNLRD
ncbi:hypothetical protein [uncultured Finegoldia sp.]|uniref:hypothetical protein n=1 Tax=uncultured Finegoldia sp. TaxID=328009 RepID=UPI002616D9D7|nr:hypothetical protein [uncultured Finegoldia sp.]